MNTSKKIKKIVLLIAGPGMLFVELLALFIHIFTASDAKPWIIGGMVVFFVIFIPLYAIEYFKNNFRDEKKSNIQFKKRNTRTEWEGGNIHGKTPTEVSRPGKLFKNGKL